MKTFEETKELMERIEATDSSFNLKVTEGSTHSELWMVLHTKHGNDIVEIHFPPRNDEEIELTQMGYEQLEEWSKRLKS